VRTTEHVTEQVTEQVKKLIQALSNNTWSTSEMIQSIGLKHRPTFLYDYLKPALEQGFIEMTIPDNPNSNLQKYRLTILGKQLKGKISALLAPAQQEVTEQVTEQVTKLIQALSNNTWSTSEMIESLGLKHRPTFLYDYLKPALEQGFIEMTIPDKPNSNLQKYRLTILGKQLRDKISALLAPAPQGL
jgi:hypothetical protein